MPPNGSLRPAGPASGSSWFFPSARPEPSKRSAVGSRVSTTSWPIPAVTGSGRTAVTRVRILLWHGWLLAGSGSNVVTARVAEVYRQQGHDVLLLCQEGHPEGYPFVDAWGTAGTDGVLIAGGA